MPLLHGDFRHIISNTFPMLILGTLLFYYYRDIAFKTFFIIYFTAGTFVWIFGDLLRDGNYSHASYHIGASAIIYGLSGFLFFSGIIRKNRNLFGISLLVTFLYGTVIWGIFPVQWQKAMLIIREQENISWEGHLFGFVTGVALAYIFRKKGVQKPEYSWEVNNDDDLDESNPYWMVDEKGNPLPANKETGEKDTLFKNMSDNPFTVNYTYIPKKENDGRDQVD